MLTLDTITKISKKRLNATRENKKEVIETALPKDLNKIIEVAKSYTPTRIFVFGLRLLDKMLDLVIFILRLQLRWNLRKYKKTRYTKERKKK